MTSCPSQTKIEQSNSMGYQLQTPIKSPDYILPLNYAQFNGVFTKEEDALNLAIAISLKDSTEQICSDYIEFLTMKKLQEAFKLYHHATDACRQAIDSFLETIPWRVAIEYHVKDDNIKWINTWIKIGWWDQDLCEISPQFNEGVWVSSDLAEAHAGFLTTEFKCVVWEGFGAKSIHHLVDSGKTHLNIEIVKKDSDIYVPVDINFDEVRSLVRFAELEIGSFEPKQTHNLDMFRCFKNAIPGDNNTTYRIFSGNTMGDALMLKSDFDTIDVNLGDIENSEVENSSDDEIDDWAFL